MEWKGPREKDLDMGDQLFFEVVDMILNRIPTNTILREEHQKWKVEMARLAELVDAIQREINNMDAESMDRAEVKSLLAQSMSGANPMGAAYHKALESYEQARSAEKMMEQKRNEKVAQLQKATRDLDQAASLAEETLVDNMVRTGYTLPKLW